MEALVITIMVILLLGLLYLLIKIVYDTIKYKDYKSIAIIIGAFVILFISMGIRSCRLKKENLLTPAPFELSKLNSFLTPVADSPFLCAFFIMGVLTKV